MPGDGAEFLKQLAEDGVSLDGRGEEAAPASPSHPDAPDGATRADASTRQAEISASLAQSRDKPEASVLDILSRPMKSRLAATSFRPNSDSLPPDIDPLVDPLEGVVPKAAVGLNLFGADTLKGIEVDIPPEEAEEDYDELSPEELAVLLSDYQGPEGQSGQEAAPAAPPLDKIAAAEGESPVVVMQRVIEESLAEEHSGQEGRETEIDPAPPPPSGEATVEAAPAVPEPGPEAIPQGPLSHEAPEIVVHPDPSPDPGTQQPPQAEVTEPSPTEPNPVAPEEKTRTRPAANPMTKPVEPWVVEMAFEEHRIAVESGEVQPNAAQAAAANAGKPAAAAPDPAPPQANAKARPAANPMTKPVDPWVAEMAFEEHRNAVQSGEVQPNAAQAAAASAGKPAAAAPDPAAPEEKANTRPAANPMTKPVEPWVAEMAFDEHRNAVQSGEVQPNAAQAAAARALEQVSNETAAPAPQHDLEAQSGSRVPAPSGEAMSLAPDPQASDLPVRDQPIVIDAAPGPEPGPDQSTPQDGLATVGFQGLEAEAVSWLGNEPEAPVDEPSATTSPGPCHPLATQIETPPEPESTAVPAPETDLEPETTASSQDRHVATNDASPSPDRDVSDGQRALFGLPELAAFRIQFDPDLIPDEAPEFTARHPDPPQIEQAPAPEDTHDPQADSQSDSGSSSDDDMEGLGFEDILRAVEEGHTLPVASDGSSGATDPTPESVIDNTPQQNTALVPDAAPEQPQPDIAVQSQGSDFEPEMPSENKAPQPTPKQGNVDKVDQQAREAIKSSRVSGEKGGLAAKWKAFRSKDADKSAEN